MYSREPMATLSELQTELAAVKTAISAILTGGQALGINGRSLTRADLGALYKERDRLERTIGRMARTSGLRRAVPGP